jgi:large subunit ribosomal protein L25
MSEVMNVTIEATIRTGTGKSYTRKLRSSGKIPAVLLDGGKSTILELDPKYLSKAWKSCDRKFTMVFEGKNIPVKIQELQLDPVRRAALHVDLMKV